MKQRHIIKKNYKTAAEMVAKNKAGVVALALFFLSGKGCLEFNTN